MSDALDDFLRRREQGPQAAARAVVRAPAPPPEQAASIERASRKTGIGWMAAVAADPKQLQHLAQGPEDDFAIARAPRLADWLTQRESHAPIARGALPGLADVENHITTKPPAMGYAGYVGTGQAAYAWDALKGLWGKGKALVNEGSIEGAGRSLEAGTYDLFGQIAGGGQWVADTFAESSPVYRAIRDTQGEEAANATNPAKWFSAFSARRALGWKQLANYTAPKTDNPELQGAYSGVRSLPASAGALLGGAYFKSAKVGAVLMGGMVGSGSYSEGRRQGLDYGDASLYGVTDGTIEAVAEFLPTQRLLGHVGSGSGLGKRLVSMLAADIPGEQLATVGQDFNRWAMIEANQGKPFSAYLEERPDAAYQTLIASVVGSSVITAGTSSIEFAANKMGRAIPRLLPAEENAHFLNVLGQLSSANAVLARDTQTFESFVRTASEGTEATDVYIDAAKLGEVFQQANLSPEDAHTLTGLTPGEIEQAVIRGEDIRIPIEQFAARIAQSPVGDQLIPHLRVDPNEMSVEEAKVYLQGAQEEFEASAERALADSQTEDTGRASRDVVQGAILGELTRAGRFNSATNEVYASVVANFYAAFGARLGKTAEELASEVMLRVQSGESAAPSFDQPRGQRLFHGGRKGMTRADIQIVGREGQKQGKKGRKYGGFYATDQQGEASGYASMGQEKGAVYALDLTPGAVVEEKTGDITRLTEEQIAEYRARGVDVVKGKDPRGRTEYAVINEQAIANFGPATAYNQDGVFFSALERAVERSTQAKASGPQWAATLKKTPGVKQEELEWTGLLDFLADVEGPVTREQILELVRGGGVRVDEVVLGRLTDEDESILADEGLNPQFQSWSSDPSNPTYRELLITLPGGEAGNPARAPSTHWDTGHVVAHARFMDKVDADGKRVLFIEEVQSDWHQKGRDQGYETPVDPATVAAAEQAYWAAEAAENIALAELYPHALAYRAQRRAAMPEGALAQFDIQYGSPENSEPVVARDLPQYLKELQALGQLDFAPPEALAAFDAVIAARETRQLRGRELDIAKGLITNGGVPNAPFKTTWPALVMKRMIRWAAEHGYQKIAWTTGQQQAERYNLSQTTGPISVRRAPEGTLARREGQYRVKLNSDAAATLVNNGLGSHRESPGMQGWTYVRMTEPQIKEAFGNDIAKRLLEGAEAAPIDEGLSVTDSDGQRLEEPSEFTLDSDNLQVGGEGMKAFYDRNLVNITNDLVKKHGAKVGAVTLRNEAEERLAEQNAMYSTKPVDTSRTRQTQPGFDITPELAEAAMGGFPLFQKTGAPRGQIAFGADITQVPSMISLLRGADLSTFLHETGHFFFEVLNHYASQPGAPADVVADRDAMLRYVGVSSVTEWENMTPEARRNVHETVARSFEAYLFEGRAPSLEMRSLFGTMRKWLRSVYTSLTQLKVELTDEVRGVFDRMLASEEAIKEVEADLEMFPTTVDKPEGVSDADWAELQGLNRDATAEAAQALERRSLRDMRYAGRATAREVKRLQGEIAEQRKAMRDEVAPEIEALPVYRAIQFLRSGKINGEPVEGEHKLYTPEVRALLKLETGDPLPTSLSGMTSTENGIAPSQIAELFGYSSADHLMKDLLFASPLKDAIEAETDARMRERYGELNSPEAVQEAAHAAVHNDVRGRFVATELAALEKAPGKKRVLDGAARRLAEAMIAKLRIRDIRPSQYEAAERRAARAAQAAGTTDLDEAVRQKRNQLFNFHAAKAAHGAAEEVKQARDYLTKFGDKKTRANIDVSYLDQIDQVLERYELRQVSNKEADRRKALAAWIEEQQAMGFDPMLTPEMLDEIGRKPWRELTVEEMRDLLEGIKNIEYLGRLTKKLLTAKDKADLNDAAGEVGQAIRDNAYLELEENIDRKTWWENVKAGIDDFFAMHRKFANTIHVFDGNKYGGVAWERFVRGMNDAANTESVRNRDAGAALEAIFRTLTNTSEKLYIPEIGKSLSLEARLMIALNWGNETNRNRILDGEKWEMPQVDAVLATLSPEHWDFAERVWAYIDSYKADIIAKERRVSGITPAMVEAEPFQIKLPDGSLRMVSGGYFPIKYDPDRSTKAEQHLAADIAQQMLRGAFTRATTRRGHLKERVATVKRPVRKDFGVIFEHVSQVIHDLSWHEYLIDANRLLAHGAVDSAVREHYGPATLRWMRKALEDIAAGDVGAANGLERGLTYIRTGASIAGLGWNLWTSLLQPIGLTQSWSRIGAKHVGRGIADLFSTPAQMNAKVNWIYEVSPFMRTRGDTMQREINEIRNRVAPKSPLRQTVEKAVPAAAVDVVADSYFVLIAKAQLLADLPTWLGQYHKSLDAGEGADRAVLLADQAVIDSQGSGLTKDLAGVQRGGPWQKLWTNFYSYFSATYNLMADRTAQLRRVGPKDLPYFAVDVALLTFVPATLTSLMYQLLKGDDDDDMEDITKKVAADNLNYMLGTMLGLREAGGAISGMAGYTGPAGARVFVELGKLGKQAGQGELDEPLLRSVNSLAGVLLHYPAGQLDRTVRGLRDWSNGDAGPMAPLVGPPAKR